MNKSAETVVIERDALAEVRLIWENPRSHTHEMGTVFKAFKSTKFSGNVF
jgi:hypothetical protein